MVITLCMCMHVHTFNLYLAHWLQISMSVVADQTDVTHAQILMDRTAVNVKMDTITLQQHILVGVSDCQFSSTILCIQRL